MTEEQKIKVWDDFKKAPIVAIIRGVEDENLSPLFHALYKGGIRFAEITFNQSAKETNEGTATSIAKMKAEFAGKMHVGAGTVMTMKQAKLAVSAGAEFLISPNINPKIIHYTVSQHLISMPGAYTPSEIAEAYENGADIVKVFPADVLGISYFKAVSAPLSHIPLMAVGSVNENNITEYFNAGIFGVGVGSAVTPKKLIAEGKFDAITELAKKCTNAFIKKADRSNGTR